MVDLSGKVAVVTGAAGGIGRATALLFAEKGAAVVIGDFDETGGHRTAEDIKAAGGRALFVRTDVSDETSVQRLMEEAEGAFGGIDYLVNNAGISSSAPQVPLHDVTRETFDKMMAINVTGTFLGMKYAIPFMLKRGGGAVVNLSSVNGKRGSAGDPSYPTSKHAVIGLTKSAALTYARQGVRVNSVGPGVVKTDMTASILDDEQTTAWLQSVTPMGRFAEPQEIANLIVFLCSDEASFITGAYYPIDGGWLAG